jgi:hypothetical protein
MRLPEIAGSIDERFWRHRLKSTSYGGQAAILLAGVLWFYRQFHDHFFSWDLFAVIGTMAVVKVAALVWFRLRD